jgi:polysaccharide biosynthesis transport protein
MIRRRKWLALAIVVIFGALAFGYSESQTKKYTAVATIQFNNNDTAAAAAGLTEPQDVNPTGTQQTNLDLVTLGRVSRVAAQSLGRSVTPVQVRNVVTTAPVGQSNLVTVSAATSSPTYSARVATAFADAFIANSNTATGQSIGAAISFVQGQYAQMSTKEQQTLEGQDLLQRVETLKIFSKMQNGVTLAQAATVPTAASSPKTTRNTVVGLFIGVLAAITAILLLDRLDQRVRDINDIESALPGYQVLAAVPHYGTASQADLEPFQMLRTSLRYFNVSRSLKVVLVTSPIPGEGKTTVAQNLARAATISGSRTLLIEADLRRPTLARQFGISATPGLVDALVSRTGSPAPFVQMHDVGTAGTRRELALLVAGGLPPNPGELLESEAMARVLSFAKADYDLIIVDSPPLGVISDAIPLTQHVDGVLVVARSGVSTRNGLRRLLGQLDRLGVPILGIAANDMSRASTTYYDAYGYRGDGDSNKTLPKENVLSGRTSSADEIVDGTKTHETLGTSAGRADE